MPAELPESASCSDESVDGFAERASTSSTPAVEYPLSKDTFPRPEPVDGRVPRVSTGVVLRLLVRNHAGVMSHVCGLFARRAFNVEGILCLPVGDRTRSTVLLLVNDDDRLEQLVRQLRKLEDVLEIHRDPAAQAAFVTIGAYV